MTAPIFLGKVYEPNEYMKERILIFFFNFEEVDDFAFSLPSS